jgi:hypothetical protein
MEQGVVAVLATVEEFQAHMAIGHDQDAGPEDEVTEEVVGDMGLLVQADRYDAAEQQVL